MSGARWEGTAFVSTGPQWTWTASADIAAGTIVSLDDLKTATPASNLGTVTVVTPGALPNIVGQVYAFTGDASAPTAFLTAFSNPQFAHDQFLAGTGLIWGVNALQIANMTGVDLAVFDSSRANATGFADFLPSINNPANWLRSGDGWDNQDESHDGIAPDVPFSTAEFVVDPLAQKVSFASGSLTISQGEGDSGTTLFTFIVERTNGTTGEVAFSGIFNKGSTVAADYAGGSLPLTFSGVIPDGASSAAVTIEVAGERLFEPDESFGLTLKSVANAVTPVYLSTAMADLTATGMIVNDDTIQTIGFAPSSTSLFVSEGNDGTKTLTFTIERTGSGGTEGEVAFSGTISHSGSTGTNADDFGGVLPTTFSGIIPEGETSATVSVTISGDTTIENNERFTLRITSVSNPAADTVSIGTSSATGNVLNDDGPFVVHSGETVGTIGVSGQMTLDIEHGATVGGFSFVGPDIDAVINNATATLKNFTVSSSAGGRIVFNNLETGVVTGRTEIASMMPGGEFVFNNAGLFTGAHKVIKSEGSPTADNPYRVTINNLATGVIDSGSNDNKAIVVRSYVDIVNAGLIIVPDDDPEAQDGGGEAIEYTADHVTLHNLAGGWIEGSHHAYTGDEATTVTNEAGGTMIGRNGSAVNIDNDAGEEDTVTVVNRGLMQGKSQNYEDSDGDAVDVDGRVNLENWGTIEGLGHNGYHKGEPNVSEAIAAGAAVIVNHKGGTIYGYGRAIQIDNSGNEAAFAPTEITNEGLIQGDGNLPTAVTPEEAALFEERIRGGEAIDIVGNHADTLTNTKTGAIVGGVKMGGGDDTLVNSGLMLATGGSAIDMGEGDDRVTLGVDATVAGLIDLGAGNDTLRGGAGRETVEGGSGDDLLDGGGGNDVLSGGEGADTFAFNARSLGAANADRIADLSFADGDRLSLFGFAEGTFAAIEGGNPLWVKADGTGATLDSLADIRELDAASAAVTVSRVAGNDTLSIRVVDADGDVQQIQIDNAWSAYAELLANGPALNEVRGTAGDDTLNGQAGDQLVAGGEGNDLLTGGAGDDTATGGAGADRFLFNGEQLADSDLDRIVDLDFGAGDKLVFSKFAAGTFAATAGGNPLSAANGGSGVVIDSLADLAELDQASAAIGIGQFDATDTLILSVTDADGDVQAIHIDNIWAAYQALIV
jgi:hypothetical protein